MSSDKRHPKSTYDAKYPYNRAEVTESGHEIHYDDTPGKERIRVAHKSGSYFEISPDGKKVEQTVGNSLSYVKGGETKTVDKDSDTKVHGSTRTNVSGDSHTETKGSVTSMIGGHSKSIVGGDSVSAVSGDSVHAVKGNGSMTMGGNGNTKVDGDNNMIVDGSSKQEVGKTYDVYAKEAITIKSDQSIKLQVGSNYIEIKPDGITIWVESGDGVMGKRWFIGLDDPSERPGQKVMTDGGPTKQVFGKVG